MKSVSLNFVMKKLLFSFSLLFCVVGNDLKSKDVLSVVTYESPRGRLGDQLFCYCKAKWISYRYKIPLYYKFFKYSDKLFLSVIDDVYEKSKIHHLQKERLKGYNSKFEYIYIDCNFSHKNTLYMIDQCFYPEIWRNLANEMHANIIHPYQIAYNTSYVEKGVNRPKARHDEMILVFKQDKDFIEEIQSLIKPLYEIQEVEKPEGIISVAVHVRKGGGFDKPYKSIQEYNTILDVNRYIYFVENRSSPSYKVFSILRKNNCYSLPNNYSIFRERYIDIIRPLKHPPDQFYLDQIKGLSEILGDVFLYVYIFTDDRNPLNIVERFRKVINNPNITFACRETENNYYSNVLDDLFAMSTFDCLIRPYSSLSQIAELIGNHKIVLSPHHGVWHEDKLIIDEVLITINDDNFLHVMKKIYLSEAELNK